MPEETCISTNNQSNFVHNNEGAKSPTATVVRILKNEVRKYKLDYDQLRQIFRQVREQCGVDVPKAKKNKLLELPTAEEMNRFFSEIKNPIHHLLFKFLAGTGLRVAEATSLEIERIDFENNQIFISSGKGDKDRVVVIGHKLKEKLRLYIQGKKLKYLFESRYHYKYTTRRIEQICAIYKTKANITKELTPHTFRHYCMTQLAQAGMSEEKRAILAGHADTEMQKTYTHLTLGGIKAEAISILDRMEHV